MTCNYISAASSQPCFIYPTPFWFSQLPPFSHYYYFYPEYPEYPLSAIYFGMSPSSCNELYNQGVQFMAASNQPRRRAAVACLRCRKRKIRCSGDPGDGSGCFHCQQAGLSTVCLFTRVGTLPQVSLSATDTGPSASSNSHYSIESHQQPVPTYNNSVLRSSETSVTMDQDVEFSEADWRDSYQSDPSANAAVQNLANPPGQSLTSEAYSGAASGNQQEVPFIPSERGNGLNPTSYLNRRSLPHPHLLPPIRNEAGSTIAERETWPSMGDPQLAANIHSSFTTPLFDGFPHQDTSSSYPQFVAEQGASFSRLFLRDPNYPSAVLLPAPAGNFFRPASTNSYYNSRPANYDLAREPLESTTSYPGFRSNEVGDTLINGQFYNSPYGVRYETVTSGNSDVNATQDNQVASLRHTRSAAAEDTASSGNHAIGTSPSRTERCL